MSGADKGRQTDQKELEKLEDPIVKNRVKRKSAIRLLKQRRKLTAICKSFFNEAGGEANASQEELCETKMSGEVGPEDFCWKDASEEVMMSMTTRTRDDLTMPEEYPVSDTVICFTPGPSAPCPNTKLKALDKLMRHHMEGSSRTTTEEKGDAADDAPLTTITVKRLPGTKARIRQHSTNSTESLNDVELWEEGEDLRAHDIDDEELWQSFGTHPPVFGHFRVCDNSKTKYYRCTCKEKFQVERDLKEHIFARNRPKCVNVCGMLGCWFVYETLYEKLCHAFLHFKFVCVECGEGFHSVDELNGHSLSEHKLSNG